MSIPIGHQPRRRALAAVIVGLALTAAMLAASVIGGGPLGLLERKVYDLRERVAAPPTAHDIIIAAIDEASLARLGRWPWNRALLARVVTRLDRLGARVIAFDAFFPEPETNAPGADAALARAIARAHRVVLSLVFLRARDDNRRQAPAARERAYDLIRRQAVPIVRSRGPRPPVPVAAGVLTNLPALQEAARYSGHIDALPDTDGVLRRTPLVLRFHGDYFPSADVQAARAYLGDPVLMLRTGPTGIEALRLGRDRLPTDSRGRALITYYGPHGFPTVSIADLLAGRVDPARIRGRIVLIGATAKGIGDRRVTPVGTVVPGVQVRAAVIENILHQQFMSRPPWASGLDAAVLLALGVTLSLSLPRLRLRAGVALGLGALALDLAAADALWHSRHVWLHTVYPSFLVVLLLVTDTAVKYLGAERERHRLKSAFQHYVAPTVVEEIIANVDTLRLGGEQRDLTVLFADIRGFTAVAEGLHPEELVRLLNRYFTRMTEQVFRHDGLLDKYMGDALMAVFGAPAPRPDHARRACASAIDMMAALTELQVQWRDAGARALDIGIGISTGPMVVGNIGSRARFDYTVIGDAVNLGARLEALNKVYGTHVLLSEFSYRCLGEDFATVREIDVARVRGRHEPVALYELIPPGTYPHLDWLEDFARAYRLFRARQLAPAQALFERLAANFHDPVSRHYVRRCVARRARPALVPQRGEK